MEININTSLEEILKSNDISDDFSSLELLTNKIIESRMTSLSTHIRGGGLSSDIKIDGESIFYDKAAQMFSDYLILSSSINSFIGRVKSASVEKEISELRNLRNLLLRNNDSWQLQKEKYQQEYNEKMPTSNSLAGGGLSTVNLSTEYYGDNGKITLVNKHLDANNQKIDQINIRLSNLGYEVATSGITPTGDNTSSSGGSFSGGSSHFSSSGGEHGGGGRTFEYSSPSDSSSNTTSLPSEPSEDYVYGEHGGGPSSSGNSSTSETTNSSSSGSSSNTTSLPSEPSEDYVYGEHGGSPSSSGNKASSYNSNSSSSKKSSNSKSSGTVPTSYSMPNIPVNSSSKDLPGTSYEKANEDSFIEIGSDEYNEWLRNQLYYRNNIDPNNDNYSGF